MRYQLVIFLFLILACSEQKQDTTEIKKYKTQAARIQIIRDTWGIPHIYGKTDADAVFGLMYTQCEGAFEKVERAYIEKLGRTTEIDGQGALYNDLLSRLIGDTSAAIQGYRESPPGIKRLLDAFADGVNYYLYKNSGTKPLLLHHFEPWYPLLFTDGAYVSLRTGNLSAEDIQRMYAMPAWGFFHSPSDVTENMGSNGFAIAPAKTLNKKALLYINPHVAFYFRMEAHMVSEEGLNAYGAVTWGQFFIYQGFNEYCGWMHTSSLADAADLYEDDIIEKEALLYTPYDEGLKPVIKKQMVFYVKGDKVVGPHKIIAYYTHNGPVVGRSKSGKYLSLKLLPASLNCLVQSWERTKAKGFSEFKNVMQLYANASTNTIYADNKGNIAYWHGNFIPKRDKTFDWTKPVDGATSRTAWGTHHSLDEIVHVENPIQGFIQNCNSSPFNVSGINTIDSKSYPAYMAPDGDNFRAAFAIKELTNENKNTPDKLISLGFNHYLGAFDSLLPRLFRAYAGLHENDVLRKELKAPIVLLQNWDRKSDVASSATTLAIEWAYRLIQKENTHLGEEAMSHQIVWMSALTKKSPPINLLHYLQETLADLEKAYGTWQVPWGKINRYQKTAIGKSFDDGVASLPVGMAPSLFGSLPSFETTWYKTTKGYGYAGNSFVAVVEFGDRIHAKAVVPGGQSFDPHSKHFSDQAELYINGKLRDVFFYKKDIEKHKEKDYHPGE